MKRVNSRIEVSTGAPNRAIARIFRGIGTLLTPLYLLGAFMLGVPGTRLHAKCAVLAIKLLIYRRISLSRALTLARSPFDSVRYFEFGTFWKWVNGYKYGDRYLDISSPRLFFLLLLKSRPKLNASLTNPNAEDLAETRSMLHALNLEESCCTFNCLVADLNFPPESFDIITCISVIEHIPEPEDVSAVKKIWQLLRPGGRLFISVPCAAEAFEEYINVNEYGILVTGEDGFTFGQRHYDVELLQSCFFLTIGEPTRMTIYGEKRKGAFVANRAQKCRNVFYPSWRESFMMGREYRYFNHVRELPGIGVIAMEFVKPEGS